MKNEIKAIILLIGIIFIIGLCAKIHYTLWRIEHPNAPTWIYFLK
jgi:predicted ferric reductase